MAKNQFKSEIHEIPAHKEKTLKSKKNKGKLKKSFSSFGAFLKNEKTKQLVGLIFLLFSVYLLIALSSFLFTWRVDQSKLEGSVSEFLMNADIQVENWLGKLGALISHFFIHQGFGIASFIFVGLFFLIGFRILFKISLLPMFKTFRYSFFCLLWVSVSLAFIFYDQYYILGGAFGYELNIWLTAVLGRIGTGIFLGFLLLAFIFVVFEVSLAGIFGNTKSEVNEGIFSKPEEDSLNDGSDEEDKEELVVDQRTGADEDEDEIKSDDSDGDYELSPLLSDSDENPSEKGKAEADYSFEVNPIVKDDSPDENSISLEVERPIESEQSQLDEEEKELELTVENKGEQEEFLSEKELNSKLKEFGEYDPTLDLSKYELPPLSMLQDHGDGTIQVNKEELEQNKDRIVQTLENYNIKIQSIKATIGPTVTLYEIVPAPGVRISKIKNLEDDIALSLAALGIRIIAPIPGKGTIGIEVPNLNPDIVSMKSVISSEKFQNSKYDLPVVIGKTISNETFVFDLAKMPHLLMAGATGQGKSVGLNAVITSLLYKKHPSQLKFVLVDPKKVELTLYNKIERHYLAKLPDTEDAIITDNQKVIHTLNSLCVEMDARYELLKNAFVRNIKEYNAKFIARKLNPENGHQYLPYIVVVVDEFADLIMTAGKEVEQPIARLAQLARAIGIHLIIATQRPSTNIITGSIKANFPARIAFRVTSGIDSRTILDAGGAEQLIGRGDMLLSTGSDLIRLQCAFVDTPEIEEITEFIGNQRGYPDAFLLPEYVEDGSSSNAGEVDLSDRDALFEDAARVIVQHQQGSASLLQRRLKLGYNRAGRIIDQLEAAGIIGPFEGSKARQVLVSDDNSLEQFLKNVNDNN